MKINRRLTLLVAAPLAVAVTFSGLALAPAASQALQADRLADMVEAAAGAAELTEHLQHERVAATALVSGQGDLDTFRESSETTDRSVTRFRQGIADLSEVPQNAQVMLDRIERSVEKLVSLRAQARSGSSTISALAFGYRIVIADLIGYRDGIAQADGVDADIADRIRAAAALSEAAEYTAQEQVTVMRAQATGGFTTASRRTFDASRLGYTESIGALYGLGPGEWRTMLERTLSGEKALEARRLEDRISRTGVDQDIDVAPKEWIKASADRQELLRSVEKRVDASVHETVSAERTLLFWTAGGELVLVVLTLVGAVVVAFRLGRVMIRRLHGLRNAARGVAQTGLPAVMSELSQPGALRGATPEEVAKRTADPVEATGDDEIGEVGEAFNAVHHEAVRLAAQQAHIHAQFAETLVGVARRGAQLTSIMVSELDTVQRDEADPERMKTLFALDHLAVRMERNTNNILVLGGFGHGRVRTDDVDCSTVVMAAAQQIERFERVSLGVVEADVGIAARAVHDVAHILAEILDNATRFSSPESPVGVTVWRLGEQAVVQIVDEGVGIPPDRRAVHNAALREPQAGVGDVRFMGLHVVARLAARHGIVVELRDSSGPGTIAEITLPPGVLVTMERNTAASPWETGTPPGAELAGGRPRPARRSAPRPSGSTAVAERERVPAPPPPPAGEPADRIAGVSASGLPVRKRNAPQQWPSANKRENTERRPGTTGPRKPPRRRDSRQVSDVLAAYAQGVNRSTTHRGRSTDDGNTERSK
ncbi:MULTISPECIES: sensor histidine kinase [Streptomyces]|uniref:sensor histidine kinase n=1 Tax=Streptomyces TaxID=1883 RepID=UPI0003A7E418|nr:MULTISPECIES: sensor histidine kinase [unclassified Streptomyces]MYW60452.1 HAMP domain-containing protein [Streptomyces sp. SID8370]MYW86210.1 HAMP domain-containing protein [Streptomyces sp. SID8371]WSB12685.1 sensor histidine kinase [Streptomyces albidoflavus]ALM43437.1 Histidine kinase [Streptomyces sp. FR-008]KAF0791167.1 histidine kinase [Streptomyces sp. FR-008]